ncbi:hypothetical protein [Candidatus Palauibacter sp.]|uniref:hypothetical protein n=1 Tax=Candidatus Palauibacter sp. TaxID=3101350 RepID=UPI003CC50460
MAGLVAGCGDLFFGDDDPPFDVPDEVIASIAPGFIPEDTAYVEVPDTVRVGEPFSVSVRTFFVCQLSPGRTEIKTTQRSRVEITPFMDFELQRNCPDVLHVTARTVSVRFNHVGQNSVVVYGTNHIRYPPYRGHVALPVDTLEVVRTVTAVLDR